MELVKKVCRLCYKEFQPNQKQQRYCTVSCSYKGKKKMAYRAYVMDREKEDIKANAETIKVQRWRPESDMAGLRLDKECYRE